MTFEGEVISIPRATSKKTKGIQARLGKLDEHRSIEETRKRIAEHNFPRMKGHLSEAVKTPNKIPTHLKLVETPWPKRMPKSAKLDVGQKVRHEQEAREKADRFRRGMKGLWDRPISKRPISKNKMSWKPSGHFSVTGSSVNDY